MKNLLYILGLIILFLANACEKNIDWETKELPVMLVVEGSFTNEYKKHEVKLSLSAEYFYNKPTPHVSGAILSITDGKNVYNMIENPAGSGSYETVDSLAGVAGSTYTLNIHLSEPVNNATDYYASGQLIQGLEIDSLITALYENPLFNMDSEMDSLILIAVTIGQDPEDINNYYEMNLYNEGELIHDTIDEVYITNDNEGINGNIINSFLFFEQFDEGNTVTLEMISVEKAYFDFVATSQKLANQSFDPFDMSGPPANAVGNIEGAEAIGFFKVGYVSRASAVASYPEQEKE
ncbi:MAG: DUF4249 domain-containing protein [Bacteroidales bacterium]|nr:DUF4249 domain-containing protein [Bacteroidales bacterium]MBN2818584.1 DUF4249 domain-containing protein [Bacteroidales bacterium]